MPVLGLKNFGLIPTAVFADEQKVDVVVADVIKKQIGVLLHLPADRRRLLDALSHIAALGCEGAKGQRATRDQQSGEAQIAPKLPFFAGLKLGFENFLIRCSCQMKLRAREMRVQTKRRRPQGRNRETARSLVNGTRTRSLQPRLEAVA